MEDASAYSVDLEKLDNLAARIGGLAGFIADQLTAIDQKAKEVGATWSGGAAAAYAEAHAKWHTGATDVQEGLTAVQASVKTAHQAYTGAVAANLRILGV
ncbi:WXG100 family type VII secretion target [Nocardia inohanensis]|uniref:WXG100 family type VII secretion target n=1 Tax=Nocardia inohanensis TaxID=209246 RepID=UPI00083191D7|nr:WXG100 family type VII secretion target [Nocardia inohanensis]